MENKKPWKQVPNVWKTEAAFWTWMKGVFRAGWNFHPVKLEFIKKYRKLILNPNKKGKKQEVWGMTCEECKRDFVQSEIQIDHRNGSTRLTEQSHIQGCVEHLLMVTFEDLRAVCKECHGVITHMERYNLSKEDAIISKEVIAFKKLSPKEQLKILTNIYSEVIINTLTNSTKRAQAYKNYLEGNII